MSEQLNRIEKWMEGHDKRSKERRTLQDERHAEISAHIIRSESIPDDIKSLDESINGNGKPGLKIEVDRNTQTIFTIRKFVWALVTATIGLIAFAARAFIG